MAATLPFLEHVRLATGLDDTELSAITGLTRPTVSAYRLGRRREYLSGKIKAALLDHVRASIDQAVETLALLEMLS